KDGGPRNGPPYPPMFGAPRGTRGAPLYTAIYRGSRYRGSRSARAESAGAARALRECLHLDELDLLHGLHHELSDAVAAGARDRCGRIVVDEGHADVAAAAGADPSRRADDA